MSPGFDELSVPTDVRVMLPSGKGGNSPGLAGGLSLKTDNEFCPKGKTTSFTSSLSAIPGSSAQSTRPKKPGLLLPNITVVGNVTVHASGPPGVTVIPVV